MSVVAMLFHRRSILFLKSSLVSMPTAWHSTPYGSAIPCQLPVSRPQKFMYPVRFTSSNVHQSPPTPTEQKQPVDDPFVNTPPSPTWAQLRRHAMAKAIPMYSFGFMDNLIMIQAGDAIDATLGSTLALSTLTSAAFGQLCSDSFGVAFGATVERFSAKLGLPVSNLTPEQALMPVSRNSSTAGAVFGVMLGCLTGMLSLLFMDTDKKEREERMKRLDAIFRAVVERSVVIIGCEVSAYFVVDHEKQEIWSRYASQKNKENFTLLRFPINKGITGYVAKTGELVVVDDAYSDFRFNPEADRATGYKTNTILCAPVFHPVTKEILGLVEFVNKVGGKFDMSDQKAARILCSTIAEQLIALE